MMRPKISLFSLLLLFILSLQLLLFLFLSALPSFQLPPSSSSPPLPSLILYPDELTLSPAALLERLSSFPLLLCSHQGEKESLLRALQITRVQLIQGEGKVVIFSKNHPQLELPFSLKERPFLSSGTFSPKTGLLTLQFSQNVHSSPFPPDQEGSSLSQNSLLLLLLNQEGRTIGIPRILGILKTSGTLFQMQLALPFPLKGGELLKIFPHPEHCFDADAPFGRVFENQLIITIRDQDTIQPWWLCGNIYYQKQIMDILESLTFIPPFVTFRDPTQNDLPLGGISKFIANRVFHYARENISRNEEIGFLKIEQVEISHDFLSGSRHARVILKMVNAQNQERNLVFEVEHDDVHDIKISFSNPSPTSHVVFITAVAGREERLRRLAVLFQRMSKKEKNFSFCVINYEENTYNISSILTSLAPSLTFNIIEMKGIFKKAPGLQRCLDSLKDSEIGFILDVDIEFDETLLNNIRSNVIPGQRFFAPIVNYENVDEHGVFYPDSPSGYATMGTGILGAYVSDIRKIGGYDTETFGAFHGWEDTDFFFRLRHSEMQVARFRDKHLVHIPHQRSGQWSNSSTANPAAFFSCPPAAQILDESSFIAETSPLGCRVYLRQKSQEPIRKGWVERELGERFLVRLEAEREGESKGGSLWVKKGKNSGKEDFLDLVCPWWNFSVVGTFEPQERFWPEYIFSQSGEQAYFLSSRGPQKGDNLSFSFHPPLSLTDELVIRTGHPHFPNLFLREGKLLFVLSDQEGEKEEVEGEKEKERQKVLEFPFQGGVAIGRSNRPVAKILIVALKDQKEQILIQSSFLPSHPNSKTLDSMKTQV